MTSTAAAMRTLRSPRRRTHGPAAGERAGALSGVIGATVLVVAASLAHLLFGSGAAEIVHTSTAPVLVIPVAAVEG
jgi:nucleotide-binding universal stress UspA family protein